MCEDTVSQGELIEELFESMVPMKRIEDVADVANAIVFMSSEEAPFMTGAVLSLDRGISA